MIDEDGARHDVDGNRAASRSVESVEGTSWRWAFVVGAGVFGYFVVLTVWVPSRLLQLGPVESADSWVRDLVVTGSWAGALLMGLVGLRGAQRAGRI